MGQDEPGKRRISLDLSEDMIDWLDSLKPEYGLRSRGALVQQLLAILRDGADDELDEEDGTEEQGDSGRQQTAASADGEPAENCDVSTTTAAISTAAPAPEAPPPAERRALKDTTAIVLIHSELVSLRDKEQVADATVETATQGRGGGAAGRPGIQLPGFVRRQARELRRSLQVEPRSSEPERGLSLIAEADLHDALDRVEHHWNEVYGQPAGEAVLEAAMVWLARDVWPQSDHSDGRPFSWSLAQQVVQSFAPSWPRAEATLARVITTAGVLEDPFSGGTLALRVPTLINRFVQRHRSRQKRTTSFEAIDQTMSVHSALRLLQLPTIADRPYSFKEIRDAYREQAQNHHPDAGGSAEAMRRLNEAYQFLKERYRRAA